MRWRWTLVVLVLAGTAGLCRAEDPNPEQLKRMLEDANKQLQIAQERKNALAAENEKLKLQVGDLTKQVATQQDRLAHLTADATEYSDRTWFYRAQYAAWREFLKRYPTVTARWESFLRISPMSQTVELPEWMETLWPLSIPG